MIIPTVALGIFGYFAWNKLKEFHSAQNSGSSTSCSVNWATPYTPTSPNCHTSAWKSTQRQTKKSSHQSAGGWLAQCRSDSIPTGNPATVYDQNGTPLKLSVADEIKSGGEGTVYRWPGHHSFVIKLFKRDLVEDPEKQKAVMERLRDMLRIETLKKNPDIAWPQMPVFDEKKRLIGFVMRTMPGIAISSLQGPEQIRKRFPDWDRKDLALVAKDFLEKMQLLANNGVLVNDFNPANFLVGKDCKVRLIDCDSYQIPSSTGGSPHISRTYFASHVAPELLLNPEKLKQPRTPEHARFGAAIIVFQLLMCGLHPYSHKYGDTPEENLKSGKSPLGLGAGCVIPDGWYNLLSYLPYTMMEKFVCMFRDGHGNPSARPTLMELQKQVDKFLFVMTMDKTRRNLTPKTPKAKTSSNQASQKYSAA